MLALKANKPYHFLLVHCSDYKNGASVILASQCIQALASHFSQSKISLLLHSSMRDFFLNNPYLNKIFCIDTSHNLAKELKNADINISLSLVSCRQSTIAIFRSGIKVRIGVFSHFYSLLFNYKVKQKRTFYKHEATYNLDLLKFLQCKQFFFPKLYLKLSDTSHAQEIIIEKFGLDSINKGYIIICPSHGIHEIGWKARNFFVIANAMATLHNVLLLAKEAEIDSYKSMMEQFPNLSENNLFSPSKHAKNSEITQMLALISLSRLFIGNNNTLLHAAAALDVSTFGILPHKKLLSPYRYAPISQHKAHLVCTPFGIFEPQDSHEDNIRGLNMDSIATDVVLSILQAKFFPNERLFIQTIDNLNATYAKPKERESKEQNNDLSATQEDFIKFNNKDSMTQKTINEDSIKKDSSEYSKRESKEAKDKSLLDIQDYRLSRVVKTSIIDERG